MEHPPTASDLFGRKRTKSKFQRAGEAQLWLSLGLHTGLVAGYDAEQPVRLAVDPVSEVEGSELPLFDVADPPAHWSAVISTDG